MSLRERTAVDDVLEARERYVARGVATPRLVVARAEGAQVEAADGTVYLDFAGGIACQNTGHGFAPVVAAIHEQVDRFLHQCFMVGTYEPYVEVCRRLAEHSPCAGENQKSILVNSGAEAIENAVKIARAATGRPAVVVFENGFHGRTLLTMAMTSKVRPYKAGFGPFPGEVYRAAAPYPYRGVDTEAAIASLEHLFKSEVEAETVACVVLETVQGEGGFIPMPGDYLARLRELCDRHGILFVADEVQSGVGRTGPMWAIEWSGVAPDLLVSGKSLGGGLPLAAVTGRAEVMDAPGPGGLGGTFGGNPVACAAAAVVLDTVAEPEFRARADELGDELRARLDELAARHDAIGEVRGLGPMLALELVEQSPELAQRITAAAFERGPAPALVRPLRQRPAAAAAADRHRRRARARARPPGGVACRRRLRSTSASPGCASATATSPPSTGSTSRSGAASSSRCSAPSGSGKTTTLRVIAGFEQPDEGRVELGGTDVSKLPPYARDVNTVFQDYALFPHMTVQENVEYGLRVKKVPRASGGGSAGEALALVRLEGYGGRKPAQLSGGQRQRVALARAIVNRPQALLLDEPLGALDLKLRQELQVELKRIQQELGITFVYVTHDQEEALTMSDRLAVFNEGRIAQLGAPAEVYEHPASEFIAGFVGVSNVLERDGRRFTVRPEKIRLLGEGESPRPGASSRRGGSRTSSTSARSRATTSSWTRAAS